MESTFKEIYDILKDGPVKGKDHVYGGVFDIVLSCTSNEEAKRHFSNEFMLVTLKFTGLNSPYNSVVYKILTNIFSEDELNKRLVENKDILSQIVNNLIHDILDNKSNDADCACMLLSNITRYQENCKLILEEKLISSDILSRIITAFTAVNYNNSCSLDQLAMVLCNFSQLAEMRETLTGSHASILFKLIPFMNHSSHTRRRGIIGVVHNCAFDSSVHNLLLGSEIDILPRILFPLAGPEQFDDEDNDKLPIDLQYLPDSKEREYDPEIRKELLETLNQLCATKFGRQFLRDHNTYIILRELHKCESNDSVLLACENVVDILIRTEDEIGIDHVKNMEIPKDLEEKFNKDL